jgi:ISXO2-like transposase domain
VWAPIAVRHWTKKTAANPPIDLIAKVRLCLAHADLAEPRHVPVSQVAPGDLGLVVLSIRRQPSRPHEASHRVGLEARFLTKRINHSEAYSTPEACTNMAESFFSPLRRAEIGIHHKIADTHFDRLRLRNGVARGPAPGEQR